MEIEEEATKDTERDMEVIASIEDHTCSFNESPEAEGVERVENWVEVQENGRGRGRGRGGRGRGRKRV